MEQANRILTLFLVLIIALALAFFLFYKLGLVERFFPGNKIGNLGFLPKNPTPTVTPTPAVADEGVITVTDSTSETNKELKAVPTMLPTKTPAQVYVQQQATLRQVAPTGIAIRSIGTNQTSTPTTVPKTGAQGVLMLALLGPIAYLGRKIRG